MPDLNEITEILNNNPEFAKDYFLKNASPKLIEQWVMRRSSRLSVGVNRVNKISNSCTDIVLKPLTDTPSSAKLERLLNKNVSSQNLPQPGKEERKKKTVEELSSLNEKDLLMELIRDIAYELDVDSLSHKILVNVSILTKGDRCSLFLVQGHKDRKYLVSRLFDVTTESTVEEAVKPASEAIIIPVGVGIAGHAAATGENINIKDAYQDPRFNPAIDKGTGYKTNSILCMPIKNQDSEVIGVAQIINKRQGDQIFTERDEKIFENYLTFCGIGLTNAQLFDASVKEYKRNQVLLNLAKNIFEDTEHLDTVVRRIMTQAQDLLQCERCTVYLLKQNVPKDDQETIQFSHVFDLACDQEAPEDVSKTYWESMAEESNSDKTVYAGFAKLVAQSGEVLNIDNFSKEGGSSIADKVSELDEDAFKAECMLCSPILNNQQEIIGVAQLLNKIGGHSFDENDETIFEGFAIFCGLGIHNTQMYEKASLMLARQKVNMEVLQYHAGVGDVDIEELETASVPEGDTFGIHTFAFDDQKMSDMETCIMSLKMFTEKDLLKKFDIPYKKMCSFILTVRKNYRPVTYHNWRHAFNVAQTMFTLLSTGQMFSWFTDLEAMVLIVACLCHDLDHRGTNNTFQQKSESPIALLYGTSTMERHHFDHSVMILKTEGSDIFTSLSEENYKTAMKLLEDAILSTDLALYFKKRADFQNLVESKLADWSQFENRGVLRGMMMTACDVSAITKPWEIQQKVAELVASEFFEQGDLEKFEFSATPMPMMDREKHNELPKMQVGFIDFVCMPIYKVFYHINPLLKPLYDGCVDNKRNWQNMVETYVPAKDKTLDDATQDKKTAGETQNETKQSKKVSFVEQKESKTCVIL